MPGWLHRITLNAVDITAMTALGATVDESENASHICDITYYPLSGGQDSDALNLQTLQIEINVDGGGWQTIFDGRVIRAQWVTKSRYYQIRASNRMQEYFRGLGSYSAVLAALPGALYSDAMFGEPPEDFWEYAQKCMETLEKDVHLDRANTLALVDWAAKGTADHVLSQAQIHNNGAFELDRIDADLLINRVSMEYQYRVQRFKVRTHRVTWSGFRNSVGITNWCQWFGGPTSEYNFGLPTKTMVESTIGGGSWNAPGPFSMSTHPDSIVNPCGSTSFWVNNTQDGDYPVWSVGADGYRAFISSIWETYQLTFDAVAAQTLYGGPITETKQGSNDIEADSEFPPQDALPQAGWVDDAIGDSYQDQEDDSARVNDLNTARQWSSARIRGSQRGNSLLVRTDARADITLADTIEAQAFGLTAKGKLRRLKYTLDAAPRMELYIAISRGNGGTDTPWVVPARPDTQPTYPAPEATSDYLTYLGGFPTADPPPVPDERLGWINNIGGVAYTGDNLYDVAFRIEWPEVEQEAVDEVEATSTSTWEVSVPQDLLVIT